VPKNGNNNDVVELWEHDFAIVRNGLDEEQVISFVNELISQRGTFLQRQEHLSSLTKLAERIAAEADNMAKQTKEEAVEQAKAETTVILAKAEEQAQQMIEEKRAEVIAMANREAEAIRANAQQQATLLLEEKTRSIQIELKDTVQSLSRQFLSQLESLQQQVIALQVEFEQTLSQAMKQEYNVTPSTDSEVNTQPADSILSEAIAQVHTVDQVDNSEVGKMTPLLAENEETVDYKGEIELQILPPVNIKQIMGIMRYLDSLSEVENTELIPVADRPSIIVFLREPVHLVEILRTLPEVGQVDEVTSEEITSFPDIPQGKRRKIQITLSKDSILAEAKEILTNEASNTQSSEPSSNLK